MDYEDGIYEISPQFNTTFPEANLTADLAAATATMSISYEPKSNSDSDSSFESESESDESNSDNQIVQSKPILLASIGEIESNTSCNNLTLHVINTYTGKNVVEKIVSFCEERHHRGVVILSATGTVSIAVLRPTMFSPQILHEGRFEIMSLNGGFIESEEVAESTDELRGSLDLTLSLAKEDASVVGGSVVGPLIAASPIEVVIGTFEPIPSQVHYHNFTNSKPVPLKRLGFSL